MKDKGFFFSSFRKGMDDERVRTDETVRLTGETAQFIGEKYKLLHRSTAGVKPCENCTVSSVNRSDMTSHVINCAGKLKVCGPLKTVELLLQDF